MTNISLGSDLSGLLGRVEAATGADRTIDAALARATGWRQIVFAKAPHSTFKGIAPGRPGPARTKVPLFTASLEAALGLCERVLPGALFALCDLPPNNPAGRHMAGVRHEDLEVDAYGPTRALTMLAAALKARIAQGEAGTAEPLSRSGRK